MVDKVTQNDLAVYHLCEMIKMGVRDEDRDCIGSHLEELNLFLQEKKLLPNW